jgi:hypothetical protein
MATQNEAITGTSSKAEPRSLAIAEAGIGTGNDFARCMSALMSDIIASMTLVDRLQAFLEARPNEWVDGLELAQSPVRTRGGPGSVIYGSAGW